MLARTFSPEMNEGDATQANALQQRLQATRRVSVALVAPLSAEDMTVQPMADASPSKWHLAHTTWFFETFVLVPYASGYRVFDERFNYCFNSYYESQGPRQPRVARGLLTRPSCDDVFAYRAHVDAALDTLFADGGANSEDVSGLIELGINHEQQHQELLLTDVLALFAASPLQPAYRPRRPQIALTTDDPLGWVSFDGGLCQTGHDGQGFAWDNEAPRHTVYLHPYRLADRLVTNGEWIAFIADGGYRTPSLWLADGWSTVNREGWQSPNYWEDHDGVWHAMSLEGLGPVDPQAPVVHVSYFEAEAFARWAGHRLPTEFEWERAAANVAVDGNMHAANALRPLPAAPAKSSGQLRQMFGDCWQWTSSAYLPYPGYKAPAGAIGEYNGKFMVSQQVLRGASCVTPSGHSRATYRNFFYPHQRWQFTGVRLASETA